MNGTVSDLNRSHSGVVRSVVIIQRVVSHYRVPFFEKLERRLGRVGIRLTVVFGQEHPDIRSTAVTLGKSWAMRIDNRYLSLVGREMVWQPCLHAALKADLVIVEQAGRLLVNYPLHLLSGLKLFRLAFWGHGRNWQAEQGNGFEFIKSRLCHRVDWWFAYTEKTARLLRQRGFDEERITVVRNTIDTDELRRGVEEVSEEEVRSRREALAISGDNIVVYCGGMYPDKRLDFLLEACGKVRDSLPDFTIIFIGAGSDQRLIEEAARRCSWIHYLGRVVGDERAVYFRMAKALLVPSLVGLSIIDSFAAGIPLVTTAVPGHGPEIAYLRPGVNGIMTPHDVAAYARSVQELLSSPERQQQLAAACRSSVLDFSIDVMVERFARGICHCLRPGVNGAV